MTQLDKEIELQKKFNFFHKKEINIKPLPKALGMLFMFTGSLIMLAGAILGNQHQPYPCDFSHGVIVKITK